MSTFYQERLVAAIRKHIAPDLMSALRHAEPMQLAARMDRITIPLMAECVVLQDKKFGQFIIDARVYGKDKDEWIGGKQVFSTRDLLNASDRAALVDYIFDSAKKEFLDFLADKEFKRMMASAGKE